MRLILFALAIANLRWARADLDRSERLHAEGEAAYASCGCRYAIAQGLARRSHGLRI